MAPFIVGMPVGSKCMALTEEEVTHKIMTNTEPNAKQWLFTLMELLPHDKFVNMSVTLWAIWYAGRKAIHEGVFQSPQATHPFVQRFVEELGLLAT